MIPLLIAVLQVAGPADTGLISAARAAAQREPVEAFGTAAGLVRVNDVTALRVPGQSFPVMFVGIAPRFRQSPIVLVYTYDPQLGPQHIREGLVPGPLQPVSGQFTDDHTLGFGMDLQVGDSATPAAIEHVVAAAASTGMSLVRYATFFHADMRTGFRSYVDMSDRALPSPTTNTCESFEFDQLQQLAAGSLVGADAQFLVALTAHAITIYRIDGVRADGRLDKRSWIRTRPRGVDRLGLSPDGTVTLTSTDGQTRPLVAP